jgi:signal transduction histidine kinase
MAVGTDTTTRTEQAEQLRQQRDRLEEFASVVSHDLRSPLEVARGRLQLYETTGDAENVQEAVRSLDRMSTLVDDLLDLARQGETVSDPVSTPVVSVARRAWSTVATASAALAVDLDAELAVGADPTRLQQLFENLFRNAVEHAGAAGEPVSVRLTDLDDGRPGFAVEDDGVGIPPADRETVFDRGFTTASNGTGFGLAIVARVVEAHGWTVAVTESERGGARFEVSFEP